MRTIWKLALACAVVASACTKSPEPVTKAPEVAAAKPASIAWVNTQDHGRCRLGVLNRQGRQEAGIPVLDRRVVSAVQSRQVDDLHAQRIHREVAIVRAGLHRWRHAERSGARQTL